MNPPFLSDRLRQREEHGLLRNLRSPAQLIDFTSNDYFGFSRSRDFIEDSLEVKCEQTGATGSRLLTGNYSFYEELESKIAAFHHAESALIFNSGYTANLGLIAALGTSETTFLYDQEIHASMIDGMRLSKAKAVPFRHNNLDSLERSLKRAQLPVFVLVEAMYSISGTLAPLKEIAHMCNRFGVSLIVDEAHATGICGPNGEGLTVEYGLESEVFARICTFSKALGTHGAAILGSNILKNYLLNFSRPLIYTTALPPPTLRSIDRAYDKLQREAKTHQERLYELILYFNAKMGRVNSRSPIQPLYIPGIENVRNLSAQLHDHGLDVRALIPPTTPRRRECLRVVLHSFNNKMEIDKFVTSLDLCRGNAS